MKDPKILPRILGYLSQKTLASMARVCHPFLEIARPILWKQLPSHAQPKHILNALPDKLGLVLKNHYDQDLINVSGSSYSALSNFLYELTRHPGPNRSNHSRE